jgi:hypothetical protein
MAREITITLTDDEYQAVAAAAAEAGEPIEALLHEAVTKNFAPSLHPLPPSGPMSAYALSRHLYSIGFALNVPTGEPDTPEEEAEEEELAQLLSKGKSLTEMIIEDRGPY